MYPTADNPFAPALDGNPLLQLRRVHVRVRPFHNPRIHSIRRPGAGLEAHPPKDGAQDRPDRRRLRFGRQVDRFAPAELIDRDRRGMVGRIGKSRKDRGR